MIKKRIKALVDKFKEYKIDGYVIPKNDEFFSEYSEKNRLKIISNFTGSAGYSIILKNKNYLFVDGRYTIQAGKESGKFFKIVDYRRIVNCNLFKGLTLGLDPKLFTSEQITKFFTKYNYIKPIKINLIDQIYRSKSNLTKPFFSLKDKVVGENYKKKIFKLKKYLDKNKSDFIFISAPENIAWLLNIRGSDNPNSPIPNCYLLLDKKKNIYLVSKKQKTFRLIKENKISSKQIIEPKNF